jgi:DNA-binding MarR family transcriptional regulator
MLETDSVDRHITHWKREVPELDPQIEGIVTRMQALVRHLQGRKEAGLAAHGLKQWEYDILWRLRSAGSPYRLTPTALTEGLGTHPATLTNRLERLERAGYVSREHDHADRRRLLVGLTDLGHQAWEATIGQQADTETDLLRPLDDTERDRLNALLRKIVNAAERDAAPLMPILAAECDLGSEQGH